MISRRNHFRRIVGAAPALILLPALAATPVTSAESHELLALGAELEAAALRLADAKQAKAEARARCEVIAPSLPDELILRRDEK